MEDYLKYKDYLGSVEFSADDGVLHGKIIGINDLVTYEGTSVVELRSEFEDAVEDYLQMCVDLEKEPNKFFKGVFNVRTSNETHRDLVIIAEKKKMKLNELVNKAFDFLVKNEDKVLN
ncbi:type II toxin-antitoxin system HicB family antitoxin [Maribacter sp. 4G9]|uniref:type II toxin-antitoxin system HicB family antitoxin n=1 Tax=Maribacter sp. 4G9 TaxID=1889777 RepID=UPI000C15DA65|nr:type II toxin-antitoxin system HicB family antitoxin [Maribacter sp. 4G9]PIB39055.1 DNA repair protein [Maribacter sp. 4G9]